MILGTPIYKKYFKLNLKKSMEKDNVSIENSFNLNEIDIVVKSKDGFHFYEVKTASSVKSCVRQAVGQLLEYSYGNGKKNASKLFYCRRVSN